MTTMLDKLRSCHTCGEIFRGRSAYEDHIKRVHQKSVTAKFSGNTVKIISRGPDGKFKCFCGSVFLLPGSFRKHAKGCVGNEDRTVSTGVIGDSLTEVSDGNMTEGDEGEDITAGRVVVDLPFDCIGESVYDNPLIVDDEQLRKIECMVNERMEFIICRRCELAVAPEHLRTHLASKHKIYCSHDTLQSIQQAHVLKSLDSIIMFREETTVLETAIAGVPVREGYKCLECGYYGLWRTMTEHFRLRHAGEDAKEHCQKGCKIQAPFAGRLKKWMGISDRSVTEVEDNNESAWKAVSTLLAKNRRRGRASTEREENVRLLTGFVARTRWDILIEGHDKKQLMGLAAMAKEKDTLHRVMEVSKKYFTEISDKLRVGDVLLRRKIESEGYVITINNHINNQGRSWKYAVQGERSEKYAGRKFKDVCTIAVLSGSHDRTGSQVVSRVSVR